jgi:hypothetical protein
MANAKKEISSSEALALLNKWKSGSANVLISSARSGVSLSFVGRVELASSEQLIFVIEGKDVKDFNFSVVCSRAKFFALEVREPTSLFFSPQRDFRDFGITLEVFLTEPETSVFVVEVFSDKFIDIVNPPNSGR